LHFGVCVGLSSLFPPGRLKSPDRVSLCIARMAISCRWISSGRRSIRNSNAAVGVDLITPKVDMRAILCTLPRGCRFVGLQVIARPCRSSVYTMVRDPWTSQLPSCIARGQLRPSGIAFSRELSKEASRLELLPGIAQCFSISPLPPQFGVVSVFVFVFV